MVVRLIPYSQDGTRRHLLFAAATGRQMADTSYSRCMKSEPSMCGLSASKWDSYSGQAWSVPVDPRSHGFAVAGSEPRREAVVYSWFPQGDPP